jgi:hypothetical protein
VLSYLFTYGDWKIKLRFFLKKKIATKLDSAPPLPLPPRGGGEGRAEFKELDYKENT